MKERKKRERKKGTKKWEREKSEKEEKNIMRKREITDCELRWSLRFWATWTIRGIWPGQVRFARAGTSAVKM